MTQKHARFLGYLLGQFGEVMIPLESVKVPPQFTEQQEKKKKDGILTSILTVERSLLVLFCILSSSQERMRYEENISAIDFHCLAFLSAAVLKALKTWLLKKPLEDGTDESKATFAICVTMLTQHSNGTTLQLIQRRIRLSI